jgi:hypothetical protein
MKHYLLIAGLLLLPQAANAQAPLDDGRFALERTAEGFVRLDRTNGTMSLCTIQEQTLQCRSSDDERQAMQDEINRLAKEVDQLKAERGKQGAGSDLPGVKPGEAEIDRFMTSLGRALQSVIDAVRDFARDNFGNEPAR